VEKILEVRYNDDMSDPRWNILLGDFGIAPQWEEFTVQKSGTQYKERPMRFDVEATG